MKSVLGFVFVGIILSGVMEAYCEEKYLCVAELSTGFKYDRDEKKWEQADFKAGSKYIIGKTDEVEEKLFDKKFVFKVSQLGDNDSKYFCKEGFDSVGNLSCTGAGQFNFNKKNGRYLFVYPMGYVNVLPGGRYFQTDEESDTPFIEIGKCSPF